MEIYQASFSEDQDKFSFRIDSKMQHNNYTSDTINNLLQVLFTSTFQFISYIATVASYSKSVTIYLNL